MNYNKLKKLIEKTQKVLKEINLIVLATIIFLLFKGLVESTICFLIVVPILSKLEVNFLSDLIFIGLLIFIILFIRKKILRNFYLSNRFLFVSVIIIFIYLHYRTYNHIWAFTGLSIYEPVKYLDIIPFFFLGIILIKLFHKNTPINTNHNKGFYLDLPLGKNGSDLLNREKIAKHIAFEILNTNSPDSSFAIGISSEWGSGKTTFIDLLERNIDENSNIVIKINPWINQDSKNIIKDFFNTLSLKLSEFNSDISPLINKYSNILIGISDNSLNNILGVFKKEETVSSEFQAIDSAIKSINKRIIIFIDDLDRLYKEEIVQVIKLIRNSANFGNTVFIAAYDRNYIISAIKAINSYNPELFLEKIFQLEIQLPNFEKQIIQKRIYDMLIHRVAENDKKELFNILLKKKYSLTDIFNSEELSTLRDATRFSNSFLLIYNFIKGEIVLSDLLNLEVLKLKYPGVYKLIFFNRDEFLETKSNSFHKTFYTLRKGKNNNEDGKIIIKSHLEKIVDKLSMSNIDIDKAISLLYTIFPDPEKHFYNNEQNLLTVSNPSSFERYSHYRLLDNNLSEIEFSTYRSKSTKEFCAKINSWVLNGLRWELSRRFEDINDYSDKNDFEKIINAIFHLARIPKVEKIENDFGGFDFNNLFNKLSGDKAYNRFGYYEKEEDYRLFIINIFEKAPSPYSFEIEFIFNIFNDHTFSYNFVVPKEMFEEIRLNYFRKYLKEVINLDHYVWDLYNYNDLINVIQKHGNYVEIVKSKNPVASELLIDFIKTKCLDDFLRQIIIPERDREMYTIDPIIPQMFGNHENFEEFLDSFEVNNYKYLREFKDFYKKNKEVNFVIYIKYEFKDIPSKI